MGRGMMVAGSARRISLSAQPANAEDGTSAEVRANNMRIVTVSDTHGTRPELPDGDVLVHCGDWSHWEGTIRELGSFARWMGEQPHATKILISGNHDFVFFNNCAIAKWLVETHGIIYLEDGGTTVAGTNFWGSPWQPEYKGWAFGLDEEAIIEKWALIPPDTDVLLTHGPPAGILDTDSTGNRLGCPHLRDRVLEVQPQVHIFGHMHEGYGMESHGKTTYVNTSICGRWETEIRDGKEWKQMELRQPHVVEI